MDRKLGITIDKSTWPAAGLPSFPSTFHENSQDVDFNVLGLLLMIGHLTTPVISGGIALNELWAYVRYIYAIADTEDLRLTGAYSDLDAHQKTILSDDFGMGAPMYWLAGALDLHQWCDGRYFMDRYPAVASEPGVSAKKRGPNKSPDFVAWDGADLIHVIECKGTQSGEGYRASQMTKFNDGVPVGGATVQKRTITVPAARQGQRLACGLSIGIEDGHPSNLLIEDPEPGDKLEVTAEKAQFALDPIMRGMIARCLRSAGLDAAVKAIAFPSGPHASSRPREGRLARRSEQARLNFIRDQRNRAGDELTIRLLSPKVWGADGALIGREIRMDLPRPFQLRSKTYSTVTIRQGVREHFAISLLGNALEDGALDQLAPELRDILGPTVIKGDGPSAQLHIGDAFFADIRFSSEQE